ncbi:TIGR02808 family protein [Aeromonas simiae]|nr:TIGR02808 family protein [Aeromonas simiae]MDO2949329.1 TIGR02808 family protein [Aeromonas simiae]MDO2952793.1 TIGR02808 family protein [Aeromonas simiae]MDO2956548.1 TIGR02808 family protein [Aeromonas simiae]
MSLLEQTIWTVLGYGVMPFIFLSGFLAVAVVSCVLLNACGVKPVER